MALQPLPGLGLPQSAPPLSALLLIEPFRGVFVAQEYRCKFGVLIIIINILRYQASGIPLVTSLKSNCSTNSETAWNWN
jgi:hypothetical protein